MGIVHQFNSYCLIKCILSNQCPKKFTMEDDNSFSLLAKNLKKRRFEARSDKHSWIILGFFYHVFYPLLGKCFCQVGAQDKDQQARIRIICRCTGGMQGFFLGNQDPCNSVTLDISKKKFLSKRLFLIFKV